MERLTLAEVAIQICRARASCWKASMPVSPYGLSALGPGYIESRTTAVAVVAAAAAAAAACFSSAALAHRADRQPSPEEPDSSRPLAFTTGVSLCLRKRPMMKRVHRMPRKEMETGPMAQASSQRMYSSGRS
ncbi:hypothetical protein CRUP_000397 [Coryphaenoides rupestris]|nr:hypothetical protein CRUP_000397 [Coryphaenoides rupestris]